MRGLVGQFHEQALKGSTTRTALISSATPAQPEVIIPPCVCLVSDVVSGFTVDEVLAVTARRRSR